MLIGSKSLDVEKLISLAEDVPSFLAYCDSLIPEGFRELDYLKNNQRYFCALMVRKRADYRWSILRPSINYIIQTTKITGYTDTVFDVVDLLNVVDEDKIRKWCSNV